MKAQFRMYPDGEIIALFPQEPVQTPGMCLAYAATGQFMEVDQVIVEENTKVAPKTKYARPLRGLKNHPRMKKLKLEVEVEDGKMKLGRGELAEKDMKARVTRNAKLVR